METKTRAVGQRDGGKERSSVRQERPGIWSVLASWFAEPVGVEVDHTESHATASQIAETTGRTDDRRDSVATPREATVAHQVEGDVKGTAGHSRGRAVRRATHSSRRVKQSASEKTTAGESRVRRKRQKRKADEVEGDSRPQPKRTAPAGPPPGTYRDPRLSRVALIYRDVVAGERVLVNYIPDDPCPWESPDSKKLSACQKGVTPSDVTFCSSYRQYQDFQTRSLLSQVASELTMWLDNQETV
ncbi:PREDICTED: uncharacterized protein LOC109466247 [Branchiostoma belcheri]|uniref:Uncharacterized protein LOC109466247 n=1 Tax=Branchiostoma belcheri TaxID=7741 RepID=A0A6P4Y4Z5_BRABE|nr:PREDICTED: uncharacterized protein LOC109466247 [Branchiostoma belcheri]